MQKKIKILQLQSGYNVNSSDLAEQIILALPSDKYEVTSAYLKGRPETGAMLTIASKVKYFDFSKKSLKGSRAVPLKTLQDFCSAEKFDIVIAHRFKPINMLMRLNHKMNFQLCIGVAHGFGDYDRLYRKIGCRFLIRDNWKMVAVSSPVKNYLLNANAGFTESNTVTINNAIDIDKAVSGLLDVKEARQALSIPEDAFVFGTIGRLAPVKGHIVLLKAFNLLTKKYPNIHLVIIGGGRLETELKQYLVDNNLKNKVILAGAIENAFRFARSFDVFVLPSLSEGLPLALLEGMSASLPVIGSDIPSIKPLVETIGKTFQSENEYDLVKAMEFYIGISKEQLHAEGKKHFSYVRNNHSIEDYKKSYLNLIEKSSII